MTLLKSVLFNPRHNLASAVIKRSASLLLTFMILFPVLASAQEEGAEVATKATGSGGQNLWDMLMEGGWAMYPLGFCCLVMLYLIFYCWRETKRSQFIPDAIMPSLAGNMQSRKLRSARQELEGNPSVLSRILLVALQKARPDKEDANKEKVETALVEALDGEENNVGQWVNYLNVVATISPMIGLLGTVSGMIGAFQTIAVEGGMGKPELLAGDIGEALITTATGLVIGIPAMIAYFIFRNRLNNVLLQTIQQASTLIDYLAGEISLDDDDEE